jgi:hypothetical protein
MKRFALMLLVACGSSPTVHHDPPEDASIDGEIEHDCFCSPLTQAGCPADDKCTWAHTTSNPGYVSCVLDGTVPVGGACTYTSRPTCQPTGTVVADDCVRGSVCVDGTCKAICDNAGGDPACDDQHACVVYPGLFSTGASSPAAAGVCEPACDPLADNDFLGNGVRGSACAAGSGCYGDISRATAPRTEFGCMPDGDAALVNRSTVAMPATNSCAEGYLPIVHATTGSTTIVCVAMCAPGDTYLGNPGAQAPLGRPPHRCATTDARGVFGTHEHCMYAWRLEELPSPFGDAVGVCIDHAQYHYDSNGDGTVDGSDATWPDCEDLPLGSAAELGCVSTTTAGTLPAEPPPGL